MRRDFSLKALAATLILTSTLMANDVEEIDSRISQTKGEITRIETREDTLQNRVDRLSDRITEAESRLGEISTQLETIDRQIVTLQKAVEAEQESYDRLKKERSTLAVQRDRVEKRLLDLLAKHISQSLVFSQSEPAQESDLIREQLFDVVKARSSRSVEHLQDDFIRLEKALDKLHTRIDEMTQRRDELDRNRERQSSLQAEQKRTLRELSDQKEQYLAQLNELIEQRNRQRQMLADLNVMRQNAVDEMHQARISREQAQQQRQAQRLKVRHLGSSYQEASRARYRGQRVKPPLDDRYQISLIKEFGPYTDPVYNIRIHNDSVTLKADEDEAVVRSVLSGTVIFAEDMRLLGRVVILEHPGNLHTIYRNLDEIAPHVKVGQNIRARQSIGRVHQELVFEVTQDGLPNNPMQLIAISK